MIYYANGCSFTWGGTLYDFLEKDAWLPAQPKHDINLERQSVVYPYHLGKLLRADKVINDSMGCGSNYRIVRTTLNYFTDLIKQELSVNDHFVTIQWTEPSRFEYYDEYSSTWNMMMNSTYVCETNMQHPETLKDTYNFYYKNMQSDLQSLNIFLSQVIGLGCFFEKYKIPYLFFTHCSFINDYQKIMSIKDIDKIFKDYNWYKNKISKSFMTGKIHSFEQAHPSKEGHIQWANLLYTEIKNKNLLNLVEEAL